MSCHGCAKSFGFLVKEHGCEKCGFAFCSKCLVNKKLCKNCSSSKVTQVPPAILQEQLNKLENPNRTPIVVYADSARVSQLKRGLSSEDQELVNRLSKLKSEIREMKNVPSQDEIEERLAKLKSETREMREIPSQDEIEERLARLRGVDPATYKAKPAFIPTQTRSNVDSATDLINQVKEEVAIDRGITMEVDEASSKQDEEDDVEMLLQREAQAIQSEASLALSNLKKDKEIQERLKALRLNKKEEKPEDDVSDDEANSIVKRIMDEARLESLENDAELGLNEEDSSKVKEDDELPWCELCNEDAQLRCLGCDGDLYCRRCWKETHQDAELKRHRIENYQSKSS